MPPPQLVKPPHFLFPSIWHLHGITEAATATAPIAGDEVLPHPRLIVSRPRRLNLTLSLNAHLPKSSHQPLSHINETLTTAVGDE
jgi:hypothetical protein